METRSTILCVDDEQANRTLYHALLTKVGFDVILAESGAEALDKLASADVDLVITDVMMPRMDGIEFCRRIKDGTQTRHLPVLVVTAVTDRETRVRGLAAGANDFLTKPIDTTEMLVRIDNLLKIKEYSDFLHKHNILLSKKVAEKTKELRYAYLDTIYRLTIAAEYRDEDTSFHIRRISIFTGFLAKSIGISDEEADIMFYSSPMHDVGKIGIPDSILLKPGVLTPEESEIMKSHTVIGGKILASSQSLILQSAEKFALYHHERWDGSGYPFGLQGKEIPLEGRILNLVDQYDALRSRRPYKPSLSHDAAVEIITEGDGRTMPSHFDPELLHEFRNNHERFDEIFGENVDFSSFVNSDTHLRYEMT